MIITLYYIIKTKNAKQISNQEIPIRGLNYGAKKTARRSELDLIRNSCFVRLFYTYNKRIENIIIM